MLTNLKITKETKNISSQTKHLVKEDLILTLKISIPSSILPQNIRTKSPAQSPLNTF